MGSPCSPVAVGSSHAANMVADRRGGGIGVGAHADELVADAQGHGVRPHGAVVRRSSRVRRCDEDRCAIGGA